MAMLHDPRTQSPDECRRLNSGFWKRDYDMCTQTETWTCDKRKLHEAVQKVCMDQWASQQFMRDPSRFLDARFGEGTGEAYRHSGQDRVAMRFDPFRDRQMMGMDLARKDDMAMATYANMRSGSTFTNTTTTSGTTTIGNGWLDMEQRKNEMLSGSLGSQRITKDRAIYKAPSKLRIPFKVETGGDLLSSLQGAFDRHTKSQMRLVREN